MKKETVKLLLAWVFALVLTLIVYAGSGALMDAYETSPWLVRIISTAIVAAISIALIGVKAKALNRIPTWLLPTVAYFIVTFFTT